MNIYFSGIGGVAIGPLSEIALDAEYGVQGSDAAAGRMTEHLESRGVTVFVGEQDGSFLRVCHSRKPIDMLVYTAALPHDHPELTTARELGIPAVKRDELISRIIHDKKLKLIAVAGTHGKTTTTGMLVWALKELGVPVSYSVGTTLSFGPSGAFDPESRYFVYECDEYDRNFLHFDPYLSVITSFDYDHSDTYPTRSDYAVAFRQFIHQSKKCFLWQADAEAMETRDHSTWSLQEDELLDIPLAGKHNRRNATLVLKALEWLEIGENHSNRDAIATFPGTDRRFEKLADNLYSDYAHHPAEIAATLQMARELSDRVVAVYQPHQNSRQYEVKNEYRHAFADAEKVYWLPTYLSREDGSLPVLTPEELVVGLENRSNAEVREMDDRLWKDIESARSSSVLVVVMGAGSVDGWLRNRLTA